MVTKNGTRMKKAANSPASSTTSPSWQFLEAPSVDRVSSLASSSARSKAPQSESLTPVNAEGSKENVIVTVRFCPLSAREIRQGGEITWYADRETIVRSELNPSIAYEYDPSKWSRFNRVQVPPILVTRILPFL